MNSQQRYQWIEQVSNNFPVLGKWQAKGLALFSAGVILAERCTLSKVAEKLLMVGKPDSQERRLQRWLVNPRLDTVAMSRCWVGLVAQQMESEEWMLFSQTAYINGQKLHLPSFSSLSGYRDDRDGNSTRL